MHLTEKQIERVIEIGQQAGAAILAIYDGPFNVTSKADESPLTDADRAAHRLIVDQLSALTPQWPVVSEESNDAEKALRLQADYYWLVDPLDGTREFVQRNGQFTVNIALIHQGQPLWGLVYVPVTGQTYWGGGAYGSQRQDAQGVQTLHTRPAQPGERLQVVGSRSHQNEETRQWLAALGEHDLVAMGSSLKLCLVAEGSAHLYPRLGPTCEWDTAAAQAVVEGAGGRVETLEGEPLRYSKESLLNPWFVVRA